jgi:sugar/nucleoside kinase (ribokinase family)
MVVPVIVVVGAVSIDLVAVREKFLEGTSNPSDIRLGLGGVGWRIYSGLEAPRRFITALARDPISRYARAAMEETGGVRVQEITDREARPPLYLALMESGNLKVGASDFRIVEQGLDDRFVQRNTGRLTRDDFLVLDANLSPGLAARLVERYAGETRIVFEPVSVEKAARHAAGLRGLFLVTPTVEEVEALAPGGDEAIARFLRERGIAYAVVTRGSAGLSLYSAAASADAPSAPAHAPAAPGREDFAPTRVVEAGDTTGAGDLLTAALLSRLHAGTPMRQAVRAAMDSVEACLQAGSAPAEGEQLR